MAQPGIALPFVIASLQMVSSDSFLFISSVLAVLGLCYLCELSLVAGSGATLVCSARVLLAAASLVAEHSLSSCAWA